MFKYLLLVLFSAFDRFKCIMPVQGSNTTQTHSFGQYNIVFQSLSCVSPAYLFWYLCYQGFPRTSELPRNDAVQFKLALGVRYNVFSLKYYSLMIIYMHSNDLKIS